MILRDNCKKYLQNLSAVREDVLFKMADISEIKIVNYKNKNLKYA